MGRLKLLFQSIPSIKTYNLLGLLLKVQISRAFKRSNKVNLQELNEFNITSCKHSSIIRCRAYQGTCWTYEHTLGMELIRM